MGFERTPLSIAQRPVGQLREKGTRVWNHNSKRPEVALCSSQGLISRPLGKDMDRSGHHICRHASTPWPKEPCSRTACHGPSLRPSSIAGLLELFVCHERNCDGAQCLGKREMNTGIELLGTFANSPLELSEA